MNRNLMIAGSVALAGALATAIVFAIASGTASEAGPSASSAPGDPTPPPAPIASGVTQTNQSPRLTDDQVARARSIFEKDGLSRSLFEGHAYSISSIYPMVEGDTGTLTGAAIDLHLDEAGVVEGTFLSRDYLGEGQYERSARQLTVIGVETFVIYVDLREGAVVGITPEGDRNFTITEKE